MFRNILVPTDGSALSRKAVRRAIALAKGEKARVTGLYVAPPWRPITDGNEWIAGFVSPQEHAANIKKAADRYLAVVKKAAAAARVTCSCAYVTGEYPYLEIVKAAHRNRCDLILMASHGRRGISRLLLGSETSKVLAHSSVPVLVCR
jgi:nucleotide-binding universal stress UspA family protein